METSFRRVERQVPHPQWKRTIHGLQARYDECSVHQALVQKLFRTITGLHALELLLFNGLAQEQGVIQRVLDELGEDIQFLALAITKGTITPLHEAYLSDFWAEEFDHPDPLRATQKRRTVSREKILSYNARGFDAPNAERDKATRRTLQKAYSGFVHGASPHIMDMCGGDPPRFHFKVPSGEPRLMALTHDALNYYLRGIFAVITVAMATGDETLARDGYKFLKKFERSSGLGPRTEASDVASSAAHAEPTPSDCE